LVQPKERGDFEWLAAQPIWSGVRLRVLLDHVEFAVYSRELIHWQLDEGMYREFVLEPVIEGESEKRKSGNPPSLKLRRTGAETGIGDERRKAVETAGGTKALQSHRAEATVLMGGRSVDGAGGVLGGGGVEGEIMNYEL
jgi:hypothetical protein